MSFDHADAASQIADIIEYAGRACTIEGRSGTFKAVFELEEEQDSLHAHGTDVTLETRAAVSLADFPEQPTFGAILTRSSDNRRFEIMGSSRTESGWTTKLVALDRPIATEDGEQWPV